MDDLVTTGPWGGGTGGSNEPNPLLNPSSAEIRSMQPTNKTLSFTCKLGFLRRSLSLRAHVGRGLLVRLVTRKRKTPCGSSGGLLKFFRTVESKRSASEESSDYPCYLMKLQALDKLQLLNQ